MAQLLAVAQPLAVAREPVQLLAQELVQLLAVALEHVQLLAVVQELVQLLAQELVQLLAVAQEPVRLLAVAGPAQQGAVLGPVCFQGPAEVASHTA